MGLLVSNPANPCSCAAATGQSQQISPGTGQEGIIPPHYYPKLTFNYSRASGPIADSNYRYNLDLLASPWDPIIRPAMHGYSSQQVENTYFYADGMTLELDITINGVNIYSYSGAGLPYQNNPGNFYLMLPGWESSDPNYDRYKTNSTPVLTASDQVQVLCIMTGITYDGTPSDGQNNSLDLFLVNSTIAA